uniref:Uncharacterized protein n=1 Tax=Cairina moschata TaxID=8855 RepID=A0A8C3C229_CAIMO
MATPPHTCPRGHVCPQRSRGGAVTWRGSSLQPWRSRRSPGMAVRGGGLLGLCNNTPYVVMLSAAHDILRPPEVGPGPGRGHVTPPRTLT